MSIKPIDFQVQIPKVNEVSKIQSDVRHKNEVIEQQQSSINRQNAQDSVNLVHKKENAQEAKINERQNPKERKEKNNKKKANNNDNNSKSSLKEEKTSVIDIRL
jgi:hypothetical protein